MSAIGYYAHLLRVGASDEELDIARSEAEWEARRDCDERYDDYDFDDYGDYGDE